MRLKKTAGSAAAFLLLSAPAFAGPEQPVPEIPAGAAPFLLAGFLAFIFGLRNFFNKK